MKFFQLTLKVVCCAWLITITSCTKDNNFDEPIQEPTNIKNDNINELQTRARKDNIYHYIRFNIKNNALSKRFINKIRNNSKRFNGKMLTTGASAECSERNCFSRNLIIEFPKAKNANKFFRYYKNNLTDLANRATKRLNYSQGTESASTDNDNNGSFFLANANFNFANQQKYFTKYTPTAVASVIKNKGNFISTGFTKCLVGNCTDYNVLIGFKSRRQFNNWVNDKAYKAVIPIRLRATKGGGTILTYRN